MKIDTHVHTTTSSCSIFTPAELVEQAIHKKVKAVVTTNHHNSYGDADFLQEAFQNLGILYFPGIEITNCWGDFLLFGENLDEFQTQQKEFPLSLLPRPDIAVVWAHPYRFMPEHEIDEIKWKVEKYIDAVEVINGNCMISRPAANRKAWELAFELDKPALAGSDAHSERMFFITWTVFEQRISTYADFINCIKSRKVRPRSSEKI
jgi:predicted metal-dependent phosphoesterase TrpH